MEEMNLGINDTVKRGKLWADSLLVHSKARERQHIMQNRIACLTYSSKALFYGREVRTRNEKMKDKILATKMMLQEETI